MSKIAWVFPGQGSQSIGMEASLKDLPVAKEKFALAEEILGWSVLQMCQEDEEKLSRTLYTQPCLYTIESILVDLMLESGETPQLVAGHSLGEYVALYAGGVFDFASGLSLVKRRAELMDKASGGKMVALIGFDRDQLEAKVEENADVVIANDNSAKQVVISGVPEAVDGVVSQVKSKRAVPLKVSGAFHSPLMSAAAAEFQEVLGNVAFAEAKIPVLSNVEPTPTVKAEELKERLVKQMTGSVRWREIMLQLPEQGITKTVEVGPGKVLTGLLKRACRGMELVNFSSPA